MKELEHIEGFIEIDGNDSPFEFDDSKFVLKVFPISRQQCVDNKFNLLDMDFPNPHEHKWIGQKCVCGITSSGYNIMFVVRETNHNINGFLYYEVIYGVCYSEKYSIEQIDGIAITGGDINYYYPAARALKQEIQFKEDQRSIKGFQTSSQRVEKQSCGKFGVSDQVDANITVNAFAAIRFNNANNPIDATSELDVDFTSSVPIDEAISVYQDIKNFMTYTAYRSNIVFKESQLYWTTEDDKKDRAGYLILPKEDAESHKDAQKRIISFDYWGTMMGDMVEEIRNDKIGFQHICDSIEGRSHFLPGRFVLILTEFEREFRNIYGVDSGRSDEYAEIKNIVVDKIDEMKGNYSGKRRRYIKDFAKLIKNQDDSYEQKVNEALIDCKDIMTPFVLMKYEGDYDEVIKAIAERIATLRNGFAHSKLDLEIEAINIADIKIIEELTYAIRLKDMGMSEKDSSKAISNLFAENITL